MKNFEIKNIGGGVLDVDDKSRRVKVAISKVGNKDFDNDVIDKGAYNKTIKERGPKGSNLIWHLTDHNASLKNAVGKFNDLSVQGDYLVGTTDIAATAWGNDVLEMYKSGMINQHSIGFRTIKSEPVNAGKPDEYRLIKEVLLYEGSAVLWGANDQTPTLSVGKSLTKEEREEKYFDTLKEINNLAKLFKSGHLTDDTFELLEIRLMNNTEILKQLFSELTQPVVETVEPTQEESLLDGLKSFNNLFNSTTNDSGRNQVAA